MKHINKKIIGLTGGIASGKSTVAEILKTKGYKVIDLDKISREVVEVAKPAYKELINFFGQDILNKDKSLNRKALGDIVFSNNQLLMVLNNIIHPYIFKELKEQILKEFIDSSIIILDIPLLFEEYDEFVRQGIIFDEIWLVFADEDTQLNRLMLRNNLDEKQATNRIMSQIPLDKKKEIATRTIDNNGDLKQLNKNVEKLLKEFK